ncbi:hypothetical protein EJ08DRAFT_15883 [Tothia fuscella]|uniref:Uncharacterized protein n=1 Tax=Tothia fuscella TaxID=1048955 RepID=A0A9P4P5D0_9PEZI|nr:hypothetical protein EJ08DRAFT_15883 [Tothia fuscella]
MRQGGESSIGRFFRRIISSPNSIEQIEAKAFVEHITSPILPNVRLKLPALSFDGAGFMETSTHISTPSSGRNNATLTPITQTTAFLALPGEIRNQIYTYTFEAPRLEHDSFPDTHIFPAPGLALAQTCHQTLAECRHLLQESAVVHGLHTTRPDFYHDLSKEVMEALKTIYFPASYIRNASLNYNDWITGKYTPILQTLRNNKNFNPTTLLFSTDCRIGGFEQRTTDSRIARYANGLFDLRYILSIFTSIEKVYVVDIVPKSNILATRDYFVEMFERCFPTSAQKVAGLEMDLLSDPYSLSRYHYRGRKTYGEINGSDVKCNVQRASEAGCGGEVDFLLKIDDCERSRLQIEVYVFSNWGDFCEGYRGPTLSPTRDGEPPLGEMENLD